MNGVTITNSYAILFAVGGGFYNAIGAGVFIKNGVTFAQFNGPNYQVRTRTTWNHHGPRTTDELTIMFLFGGGGGGGGAQSLTGGSVFVGAGHYSATGVPCSFYGSTGSYSGQGGFLWVGSGNAILIGHPMAIFAATFIFMGLGGTFALDGKIDSPQ